MSMYWLYVSDQSQPYVQPLSSTLVGQPVISNKVVYAATGNKFTIPQGDPKIAWSYLPGLQSTRPDTSKHFHIFVGDLCPKLHPSQLHEAFAPFGQISECKIIQDPQTMNSKGYGFVTFVRKEDAENAIKAMNGQLLGSRTIRTNWAVRKKSNLSLTEASSKISKVLKKKYPQFSLTFDPMLVLPDAQAGKLKITTGGNGKTLSYEDVYFQSGANNCTVYCGGIMTGLTEELITKTFSEFGNILDVRIFGDKGYAFIRFDSKESATRAIVERHLSDVNGHVVKCSWGKKSDELPIQLSGSSPSPSIGAQLITPTLIPAAGLLAPSTGQTSYTNLTIPSADVSNQLRYFLWPEGTSKMPEGTILQQPGYSLPIQIPTLTTLQPSINTLPQQQTGYLYSLGL